LAPQGGANLYLQSFAEAQISLFNVLAEKVPAVSAASLLANRLLSEGMSGADDVTVIDIGIGTGRQMVALSRQLHQEGKLPARLRIIGVEPAPASLEIAGAALSKLGAELDFQIEYVPVARCVADLDAGDWAQLR
jgi:predicted RNA methylase